MSNDTGDRSAEVPDSPPKEDLQSSNPDDTQELEKVTAELAEYKSRLGNAVRVHGEESKALQSSYTEWASGMKQYYDELAADKDKTIGSLEDRLVNLSDSDGAKEVFEQRREREEEESARREARKAQEEVRQNELKNTVETATRTFPDVTAEDLGDATTPETVWKRAREVHDEKQSASMEERVTAMVQEQLSKQQPAADPEVIEQEEAGRVPGPSSSPALTPHGRGANNSNDVRFTRLNQLREQRAEAKTSRKLARAMSIDGEIRGLELELKQEGLIE